MFKGSIYDKIISEDWFQLILKNKDPCVKNINDLLSREFFRGVFRYVLNNNLYELVEICPAAVDKNSILKRLNDKRFCNKCFYYIGEKNKLEDERHDWDCDDSPWNMKHFQDDNE